MIGHSLNIVSTPFSPPKYYGAFFSDEGGMETFIKFTVLHFSNNLTIFLCRRFLDESIYTFFLYLQSVVDEFLQAVNGEILVSKVISI